MVRHETISYISMHITLSFCLLIEQTSFLNPCDHSHSRHKASSESTSFRLQLHVSSTWSPTTHLLLRPSSPRPGRRWRRWRPSGLRASGTRWFYCWPWPKDPWSTGRTRRRRGASGTCGEEDDGDGSWWMVMMMVVMVVMIMSDVMMMMMVRLTIMRWRRELKWHKLKNWMAWNKL